MRAEGWEHSLADHVGNPPAFEWGTSDCALWAASWVLKATGRDLAADWVGRYATEDELHDLMRERGYRLPSQIADSHLNRTPVRLAKRGDIVQHPDGALGVCAGVFSFFLTDGGVTRVETPRCPRAWAVG